MIVGLDVGFGYTKRVTAAGTDVFPSVVGEWRADGFRLGARLNGADQLGRIEGVTVEGRSYAVGERALRLAHRRFVGLHRRWTDSAAFRVLALTALARGLERRGSASSSSPAFRWRTSSRTARPCAGSEGEHEVRLEPSGRAWRVTIGPVTWSRSPSARCSRSCSTREVSFPGGRARGPGRRPRRRLRTTDYFTLDGLEVVPALSHAKHRLADLLLDLGREVIGAGASRSIPTRSTSRAPRRAPDRRRGHRARPDRRPWLDRHAEAIAAHARMLWGDGARPGPPLGDRRGWRAARLPAPGPRPHAEARAPCAALQNAVGYFRAASASTRTRW